ncbi:MAG TPA: hypothetical protein DGG94_14865, partial [Micromonosporaceae bacterium]|nr:hypothetical protein [Micromonosporaceae bacterium]
MAMAALLLEQHAVRVGIGAELAIEPGQLLIRLRSVAILVSPQPLQPLHHGDSGGAGLYGVVCETVERNGGGASEEEKAE